jgi:hypothetical protein
VKRVSSLLWLWEGWSGMEKGGVHEGMRIYGGKALIKCCWSFGWAEGGG